MSLVRNVLISCADADSQPGQNTPKCLEPVDGRPLIYWQLDHLQDIENVVVVISHKASEVMAAVMEKRPDAIFVVNHDPQTTSLLDSMAMAVRWLREPFVYLEGDCLVDSSVLELMADAPCPSVGIRRTYSEEPLCVRLGTNDREGLVVGFTKEPQEYEWIGLAKLLPQHVKAARGVESVSKAIERFLPVPAVEVQCVEAESEPDFERARSQMKKWLSSDRPDTEALGA